MKMRPLLEEYGHMLLDGQSIQRNFVPKILAAQKKDQRKHVKQHEFVGLEFDGTNRLGEALNITTRTVSTNFVLAIRLSARSNSSPVHISAHMNNRGRIVCYHYPA